METEKLTITIKEQRDEEKNCDVCGISLIDKSGTAVIALGISVLSILSADTITTESERVKTLFGKTDFNICYVCLLRSLGVKENER